MNVAQQLGVLRNKQFAIQESIQMLNEARMDLLQSGRGVGAWSTVGVLASVALIPLNCIVNSFQLKTATSMYQLLAQQLYGRFGKSGTRLEGKAKTTLSLVKQAITAELKYKALTEYIPGVNILVGLAEDSVAAWQMVALADTSSKELQALMASIDRKIASANQQLRKLGVDHNDILESVQRSMHTG